MSLITPDFGLLVWMTLIFGIVFFILAKWGFPAVTGMVAKRNERISESIRKAKEAEESLRNLAQEQQKLIEESRKEQSRILNEAAAARDEMIAQAKIKAQEEAGRIIDKARTDIEAQRESAMREIRSQIATISVSIAEKLVRGALDSEQKRESLINSLIDEARNNGSTLSN